MLGNLWKGATRVGEAMKDGHTCWGVLKGGYTPWGVYERVPQIIKSENR